MPRNTNRTHTPDEPTSDGELTASGATPDVAGNGDTPGEPATPVENSLDDPTPVATPDAGHEDQVPTATAEPVQSPDEQPALSADTEWVDYDTDPGDAQDTAKLLLDAADSAGADPEREVLTVGGGFRVSRRVADAAGL